MAIEDSDAVAVANSEEGVTINLYAMVIVYSGAVAAIDLDTKTTVYLDEIAVLTRTQRRLSHRGQWRL